MRKTTIFILSLCALTFVSCSDDEKTYKVYSDGTENNYSYVDLGLTSGTLWATINVGATKPQDAGNYYAWGEVTHQADNAYTPESYLFYVDGEPEYSKYNTTDAKDELDIEDDAANVNWGGNWKTPTIAQWNELKSECYWVLTTNYNNSKATGYIVYKAKEETDKGKFVYLGENPSPSYNLSDAHIFLPASGYRAYNKLWYAGMTDSFIYCYYLSSSKSNNFGLGITQGTVNNLPFAGQPVRPVFKP